MSEIHQLKFAANISTMFKEVSMEKRFAEAKKKGFTAVEAQFFYDYDINLLRNEKIKSGLEVTLINSPPGYELDLPWGEPFGLACIPGLETAFLMSLNKAAGWSIAMQSRKVHVLAGLKLPSFDLEELKTTFINNMKMASNVLGEQNITVLIEPICAQVKENYFLDSFDLAIECLQKIDRVNVKLILDIYHLHMINLDSKKVMEEEIEKYLPYTGHIQISQAPNRSEPSAPGGEINYKSIFKCLEKHGYQDFIGLEYTPSSRPDCFEWLHSFGIKESEEQRDEEATRYLKNFFNLQDIGMIGKTGMEDKNMQNKKFKSENKAEAMEWEAKEDNVQVAKGTKSDEKEEASKQISEDKEDPEIEEEVVCLKHIKNKSEGDEKKGLKRKREEKEDGDKGNKAKQDDKEK